MQQTRFRLNNMIKGIVVGLALATLAFGGCSKPEPDRLRPTSRSEAPIECVQKTAMVCVDKSNSINTITISESPTTLQPVNNPRVSFSSNPYNISGEFTNYSKCDGFPELNYWSAARGLDPLYVRAIAWQESGLDTENPVNSICTVSYPVQFSNKACNDANYPVILDPTGICDKYISAHGDYTRKTGANYVSVEDGEVSGTPWLVDKYEAYIAAGKSTEEAMKELAKITDLKPCGLGILQNLEYPYTYNEEVGGGWGAAYPVDPTMCAPEGKYNPYNITHSACLGTYKLRYRWDYFEDFVTDDPAVFGIYDDDPVKIKYVIGLMVAYSYQGQWEDGWVEEFVDQSALTEEKCNDMEDVKKECCANSDFIQYITSCKVGTNLYGLGILKKYNALVFACGEYYESVMEIRKQDTEKPKTGQ